MDIQVSSGSESGRLSATRLEDFDPKSGSLVERALFNWRPVVLAICFMITAVLGWEATHVRINANFFDGIPTKNTYMVNLIAHYADLSQQGNTVRIIVEADNGTILNPGYLQTLENINTDVSLLPGVDRGNMLSLWAPTVRWTAVTQDGFDGGTVIPDDYDGTAASVQAVQNNLFHSGQIGKLVAPDFRSSVIVVPLRDVIDARGTPISYGAFSNQLEQIRKKYAAQGVTIHITGFAKVVGDIINATPEIAFFFLISIIITAGFLFAYTHCLRSTALVVLCSLIAVVWQLGLVVLLGFELDPYTELVPFLIFAIGMSHGAQKMNGIMQDIGRGTPRLIAARMTFRRLFMAGFSALVCDAVGFAVLSIIPIVSIQHLAIIASLGVSILIFTNLILLPIFLSYTGVKASAASRALQAEERAATGSHFLWDILGKLTTRRWAIAVIAVAVVLAGVGYQASRSLQVGDLGQGAPELRVHSQYNRDNAYAATHYGASTDVFVVMVTSPPGQCTSYAVLHTMDQLEWAASQVPGVVSTESLATAARYLMIEINEQNFKWFDLPKNQYSLDSVTATGTMGLSNDSCTLNPLLIYLGDHKAGTLLRLTAQLNTAISMITPPAGTQILLAGGSAGIAAATNDTVKSALNEMLFWVYGAVTLLCLIAFRSWRAVLCAVLPLILTSILAEALMVALGIGVKVATLPVVALGVGIGVDYALYVLSIVLARLRAGESLYGAYRQSLMFTGRVVLLTGFTLATSVAMWVFSPIRFQADMGLLLSFMFIWNMIGALVLLPALAHFLLKPGRASRFR
jgi:predicted RND superfamily exporter protein